MLSPMFWLNPFWEIWAVLDSHGLVGNPNNLASSCLLRSFNIGEEGAYISPDRFNSCLWHTHLDTARVHASSFPFPHQNQELLVGSVSIIMQHKKPSFITKLILFFSFRANTAHYLLHGCHHKHPQDGLRLVFPPTATAILLVPVRSSSWFNSGIFSFILCFKKNGNFYQCSSFSLVSYGSFSIS